jgi:hypothetical protein
MKKIMPHLFVVACLALCDVSSAECAIAEEMKKLDPVEVGYCESDVVFIGKVEQKIDTIRAFTEPDSDRTKHFAIQRSTVRVQGRIKGELTDTVTMISELYDKDRAFEFENLKTYVIFGKKLATEGEYAGASAKCSIQPTVLVENAKSVIQRLERIKKGTRKVDCDAPRKQ